MVFPVLPVFFFRVHVYFQNLLLTQVYKGIYEQYTLNSKRNYTLCYPRGEYSICRGFRTPNRCSQKAHWSFAPYGTKLEKKNFQVVLVGLFIGTSEPLEIFSQTWYHLLRNSKKAVTKSLVGVLAPLHFEYWPENKVYSFFWG